jgi:EAL domain-containing protein (putative c-di-GMP-specific phosphodiesterase class I)
VVRAAIGLAQDLAIDCIAEGVETQAQAEFLLSAGCRFAQGFHFSMPVDAKLTGEMLRQGRIGAERAPQQVLKSTAA